MSLAYIFLAVDQNLLNTLILGFNVVFFKHQPLLGFANYNITNIENTKWGMPLKCTKASKDAVSQFKEDDAKRVIFARTNIQNDYNHTTDLEWKEE